METAQEEQIIEELVEVEQPVQEAPVEQKKVELTLKQRKWLHEYMEDGNATRAALVVYYPEFPIEKEFKNLSDEERRIYETASSIGYENLRKPYMPFNDLMEEAGLTNAYLVQKLKENLNATRLYGQFAVAGMDGAARNKALEIALKARGELIDRVDHTTLGKSIEAPVIRAKIKPRKNVTTEA